MLSLDTEKYPGVAFIFNRITEYITDTLIEENIIKPTERKLYLYCFGTVIETLANLVTTLLIGVLLGKLHAALIFMLIFIPMRSTAGGYHCETAGGCYLLSMAVYLIVLLTYGSCSGFLPIVYSAVCLLDTAAVTFLSPVVSPNKPMTAQELKRNRMISIMISSLCTVLIFGISSFNLDIAAIISETLTISVLSMIFGWAKHKIMAH